MEANAMTINHENSEPIAQIKSVIKSDNGELWASYTMREYMNFEKDPNYVAPKISRYKHWREKKIMAFWYKVHRMADDHGACDVRCC
jgi:hypothetical protein